MIAAVSCGPVPYRLGAGGIGDLVDRQAGPCMASVHGILGWVSWAVHGAWYMASVHGSARRRASAIIKTMYSGDLNTDIQTNFNTGPVHLCDEKAVVKWCFVLNSLAIFF